MTEELRYVGCQDAGLFEPGCRLVATIAQLESLEAGRFARVFPGRPDRLHALAE